MLPQLRLLEPFKGPHGCGQPRGLKGRLDDQVAAFEERPIVRLAFVHDRVQLGLDEASDFSRRIRPSKGIPGIAPIPG